MFKSPGIPDIYVEYEYKGKDDLGRTKTFKQSVCIEIETNLTSAAEKKKMEQFTRPGIHEPIIIDMGKGYEEFKNKKKEMGVMFNNDIECIAEYIESMLVL
ncbi:MAG: hypothetical protein BWY36_01005 [Candidatus Diapherotrites archaeon ADurb.Bin253]|jgi:hypothetical protein|nr:MAG: hypothetical protein BWY36_01005 [Candidatus Diapherotrites archaeon ADurb.Bin253]